MLVPELFPSLVSPLFPDLGRGLGLRREHYRHR